MYERKIPLDLDCGVNLTREVLAGKWKTSLIYHIAQGRQRPSELQQKLPGATRRVLHLQLNQLEQQGLIGKTILSQKPLHVAYQLTALGETLLPVITVLGEWGEAHRDALEQALTGAAQPAPPPTRLRGQ